MVEFNRGDLDFILQQILISEAHADGADLTDLVPHPLLPWGVRTVDGTLNNLIDGRDTWGAADQPFLPLTTPTQPATGTAPDVPFDINGPAPGGVISNTDYGSTASVVDTAPRTISNLIADQTINNFAAVVSALVRVGSADPYGDAVRLTNAHVTQAEADAALLVAQTAVSDANAALDAAIAGYVPGDPASIDAIQDAAEALTLAETALASAEAFAADPDAAFAALAAELGLEIENGTIVNLNLAPDEGISAPFNSWMTLFGQFFDHGLDLVEKLSTSRVYVPLEPDDPLYNPDTPETNFMVVTRTTSDARNLTTPFVDQNQTYTSHASHQVFLREYVDLDAGAGVTIAATGHLLEGSAGGLATWRDIKDQAVEMLGLTLDDMHIHEVPLLATDLYGMFERAPNGYAMVMVEVAIDGGGTIFAKASGKDGGLDLRNITAADLVASSLPDGFDLGTVTGVAALGTGHAFLDDIAHTAAPQLVDPDRNPGTDNSVLQTADDDLTPGNGFDDQVVNEFGVRLTYDNELLDRHFITGDGRGNENIGLTAVHHVFHSEHNRLAEHTKDVVLGTGDLAFINQWLLEEITEVPADLSTLVWNGERLFQAARFGTEMQYQHLVFEEFARKVNPMVDLFVFNPTMDVNPAIFAEFAHVVYRFGHSMLNETVDRLGADGQTSDDIGLIQAFLNPVEFNQFNGEEVSADVAAGAIARAMTRQTGNAIDEFITEALRNNLLGLPLDLATVNLARGRETNMPTLQEARAQFYEMSRSEWLKPYTSWVDFTQNLKNPASVVNFLAAYGTHEAILAATTLDEKRAAANAIVFGDTDGTPDTVTIGGVDYDISDRSDFLSASGDWGVGGASADGTLGGLNNIDLWIGGLAESILPFGGMLGSTFTFVFELQMENLQNGDRFYYLSRTQGLHFLTELENNAFSKIIMANTDLGAPGATHVPGEIFASVDYILEVNTAVQTDYNPDDPSSIDPEHDDPVLQATEPKVARDLHLVIDGNTYDNSLKFTGGEHVVLGGTNQNDVLIGSLGDDTIWGDGGDDYIEGGHGINRLHGGDGDDIIYGGGDPEFLHGDAGNDVIHAGNGLGDLVFGGAGHDFIQAGEDGTEVFAGEGNDFILGTRDVDFLLGGEGDDWIEGSEGFDTLAGDNSELFFNSTVIGHDVMFAGTNENDFDAESGDDIMVQGESVMRNEGMFGFDWVSFQEHTQFGVTVNMNVKIFTTVFDDILRNRFDRVEALSATGFDDIIIGDDRVSPAGPFQDVIPVNEQSLEGDELNTAGVERISGLHRLLGFETVEDLRAAFPNDGDTVFDDGNILLGNGGSDSIQGGGGNDILDGDSALQVRIGIRDGAGNEIGTAFKIQGPVHFYTAEEAALLGDGYAAASEALLLREGAPLDEFMFDRSINPGNLSIVREVVDGGLVGDVDVAVFRGSIADYDIVTNANGSVTVTHNNVDDLNFDGTDTLWNMEVLQFVDGVVNLAGIPNNEASGFLSILLQDNVVPGGRVNEINVGDVLTVDVSTVIDGDGVPALSAFTFRWQVEEVPGVWVDLEDPVTEIPITGPSLTITDGLALDGLRLRVVGSFRDEHNFPEVVQSFPTDFIVGNAPAVPDPAADLGVTGQGLAFTFTLTALLANATDVDTPLNQLSVANLVVRERDGEPVPGFVEDNGNGTFTFIPDAAFTGAVTFVFDVTDGTNFTPAEAILEVLALADLPAAGGDTVTTQEDTPLVIASADLLANDQGIPGQPALTIATVGNAFGGTAVLSADGTTVTFTPDPNFNGTASFEYFVTDGVNVAVDPGIVQVIVTPVADAIEDLQLFGTLIFEDIPGDAPGAVVVISPDEGQEFTFTVSDPNFEVVDFGFGPILKLLDGVSIDFETGPAEITLSITATPVGGGTSITREFTLTVADLNDPPTEISPLTGTITENVDGAIVATLVTTDADAVDSHTYDVAGDSRFEVVDGVLKLRDDRSVDFEEEETITLTVTSTDLGGLSVSQDFVVTVLDANDAPTGLEVAGSTVNENEAGAIIGPVVVLDADVGDTHTFTFSDDRFEIVDGNLKLKDGIALDFETEPQIDLVIEVFDAAGLPSTNNPYDVRIDVLDANEGPSAPALSTSRVNEFAATGTVVGLLSSVDPDAGDGLTFALLDNAGGRFSIVNNEIRVANGVALDFEQATEHTITVEVSDASGSASQSEIVISVDNVDPENVTGTSGDDTIVGGEFADRLDGSTGVDTLVGRGGNDHFIIDSLADIVIEDVNGGMDSVHSASVDIDLANYANVEAGVLNGSLALSVTGTAGSDYLSGYQNTAANNLIGGTGHDTYLVGAGDRVFEDANGGIDRVIGFHISIDLDNYANVEVGELRGVHNLSLNGNSDNNTLIGNNARNRIDGEGGDDRLIGGGGDDFLIVTQGNDTIVVTSGFGNDTVRGFDANAAGGQDIIDLRPLGITADTFDASVTISLLGNDTFVDVLGQGSLTLLNVNGNGANSVTVADFLLS